MNEQYDGYRALARVYDRLNAEIDYEGWTPEVVAEKVEYACTTFGKKFYIPSASQGGPYSTFPGVYETMDGEIEKMSAKLF